MRTSLFGPHLDGINNEHKKFVTHYMEMPSSKAFPMAKSEMDKIARLDKPPSFASGGRGFFPTNSTGRQVKVKDPATKAKLIKKP